MAFDGEILQRVNDAFLIFRLWQDVAVEKVPAVVRKVNCLGFLSLAKVQALLDHHRQVVVGPDQHLLQALLSMSSNHEVP